MRFITGAPESWKIRFCNVLLEHILSIPANLGMTSPHTPSGAIAGSVLPIRRAEELIATLQGVLSVRIVPNDHGSIDEIHVLTTNAVLPKQTVRNIESALIAQLGWRVNHRKISIATTLDPERAVDTPTPVTPVSAVHGVGMGGGGSGAGAATVQHVYGPPPQTPLSVQGVTVAASATATEPPVGESNTNTKVEINESPELSTVTESVSTGSAATFAGTKSSVSGGISRSRLSTEADSSRRVVLFEDLEVRRSRTRGVTCKVTLSRDGEEFYGEAEGQDSERSRIELAARAAVLAILGSSRGTGGDRALSLEGAKQLSAFDREFIFVSIGARIGRETMVLTGSCEVRESTETSSVLAVLDATNRWMNLDR